MKLTTCNNIIQRNVRVNTITSWLAGLDVFILKYSLILNIWHTLQITGKGYIVWRQYINWIDDMIKSNLDKS